MNIFILTFHKHDKAFASDLYLIYNRSPAARVCKSDTDRLLMLYLVHKIVITKVALILNVRKFILYIEYTCRHAVASSSKGRCENPECRNITEYCGIWRNITEYGGISRNITTFYRNIPEHHNIFRW